MMARFQLSLPERPEDALTLQFRPLADQSIDWSHFGPSGTNASIARHGRDGMRCGFDRVLNQNETSRAMPPPLVENFSPTPSLLPTAPEHLPPFPSSRA
jgi:hypothetical protein